ncbi:hypothetical protein [Burkholderia sp. WSM2232]
MKNTEGDLCRLAIGGNQLITGYVDERADG